MTVAPERKRPVAAVLYREGLPPRLAEIAEHADVRLTKADGLAKALDGADVLYQWHSFSPALRENWDAASSLQWVHVSAAGVSQLLFDGLICSNIVYTNSRGVLSRAIAEFALGFVLDLAKDSKGTFRLQQEQRWQHRVTRKIQGQRVLVVGTGSIGREIAVCSGRWAWRSAGLEGMPARRIRTSTGSTPPGIWPQWSRTMTTSCSQRR